MTPRSGVALGPAGPRVSRLGLVGWALFDWAAQPWFTLVTTFVVAPYVATRLAATPAEGQAAWAYSTAVAGLCIALLSPVLGGIADQTGRRKPWTLLSGAVMAFAGFALYAARPGEPWALAVALVAFAIGTVGGEVAAVFNNAMMTRLVSPAALGRLSGIGWACGYLGGLVSLVIAFGFLLAEPTTGRTAFGLVPPILPGPEPVDTARLIGPFAAIWFLLFILPMLVFTPEGARRSVPLGQAAATSLGELAGVLRSARAAPGVLPFLVANMLIMDGLAGVFAFGGIYAAGVLGWSSMELGLFGILATLTGALGAVLGGWADDRFGSRAVVTAALVLLIVTAGLIVATERDRILFVVAVAPRAPGAPAFSSVSEIVFLGLGGMIGFVAGPLQAGARTLLARLAPPDQVGQYFGLFALSGRVTSFAAPLAVGVVTDLAADQRLGVSVLAVFLVSGLIVLRTVRSP